MENIRAVFAVTARVIELFRKGEPILDADLMVAIVGVTGIREVLMKDERLLGMLVGREYNDLLTSLRNFAIARGLKV